MLQEKCYFGLSTLAYYQLHQHGDNWTYYFLNGEVEELDADITMNLVNLEVLSGGDTSFNVTLTNG